MSFESRAIPKPLRGSLEPPNITSITIKRDPTLPSGWILCGCYLYFSNFFAAFPLLRSAKGPWYLIRLSWHGVFCLTLRAHLNDSAGVSPAQYNCKFTSCFKRFDFKIANQYGHTRDNNSGARTDHWDESARGLAPVLQQFLEWIN